MKFTISVDLLGNHYVILSLSELCLKVEKKIFKRNNAVSLYNFETAMRK